MKRLLFSCIVALSLCACERVELDDRGSVSVELRFIKDYVEGKTKSSVVPLDIEAKESGGVVAFYDAGTGQLISRHRVDDLSSPMSFVLKKAKMNVYVLGNIWLIDGNGDLREPAFPTREEELQTFSYELGGVSAGNGWRTERFDEIGEYGIPVRGILKDVEATSGAVLGIGLERMFSKVRITVDHGGMSLKDGMFRNEKLYFRQANFVQTPFAAGGSRALAIDRLAEHSDYESPMEDGEKKVFVFYLPENRQMSLNPELATFVEFTADIDKSAGGFGGRVTYRFYLGKNPGTDNDLEGNVWYDILLSFKVNSLFEPSWQVNPEDDFSDGRMFCVMKDKSCETVLGEQDVVVRPSRPGKVYVYMNRNGAGGENHLIGSPMVKNFAASNLEDCAWTGDFSELAGYGISASWDASEGRLSLAVTDTAGFVPEKLIPVTLRLLPGSKQIVMNVKTSGDQALKFDSSEYYLGMKRTASISGFAGQRHSVRTLSESGDSLFRTSDSPSAPFVGYDGESFDGNSVDLYAWNCCENDSVTLVFESDDSFNDDPVQISLNVWKPLFRKESKDLSLLLDGTGVEVDYGFDDRNGKLIDQSLFSPALYESLLAPTLGWSDGCGDVYAGFGSEGFYIDYLGHYAQEDWIGDMVGKLGTATVKPKSDLYQESSTYKLDVGYPRYERDFPVIFKTDYLNEFYDSSMGLSADFNTFGNNVSFTGQSIPAISPLELSITESDDNVKTVELQTGEIVDLAEIPSGLNVITASLSNPRVTSGDKVIDWTSFVTIYHNMTIAPFGVFLAGSSEMTVYLTYPKAAWMLEKYYMGGTSVFPKWETAGTMDCHNSYIWSQRFQTTGPDVQTTISSTDNCLKIKYCDIFPSDYPDQKSFTLESAIAASSRKWVNQVRFKLNDSTLGQPLHSEYIGGTSFYRIVTSDSPIAWLFIDK